MASSSTLQAAKMQQLQEVLRLNESKALSVEDAALQARARGLMPLAEWRREAEQQVALNTQLDSGAPTTAADDLVVQSMLQWFKASFFSWVDLLPCSTCGSATREVRMGMPTAAEQADGAGRVELHVCPVCGQETRFPRHTSPAKLLETRRGRCGEWAQCFLLMLRAAGYDARYVCDNADHVWTEYYSEDLGQFVHVDACEAAWNTPLLYAGGWGKRLSHVLAGSRHGHADVTKRYVLPTELPQLPGRRAGVPEGWLSQLLLQVNMRLRRGLSRQQRTSLAVRDATELMGLLALESEPAGAAAQAAAAAAANLPGRQSGADAWRAARGEDGSRSSTTQRAAQSGTAYALAQDASLPPLFVAAGRVTGGACRASGQHSGGSPTQVAVRLFDGSLATKWLDFGGGGEDGAAWVEYRLLQQARPTTVSHYDLVAAEDCPERDPCDWVLEAAVEAAEVVDGSSSSGGNVVGGGGSSSTERWVVLDRRSGHRFSRRHQLCSFQVAPQARVASRRWRLSIGRTADPPRANSVQLACWSLYAAAPGSAGGGGPLPSLSSSMRQQLAALLAAAAAGEEGQDGGGGEAAAAAAAAATARRVLANLVQHPGEPKFNRLNAASAKLQPVLAHPVLAAALAAAGFRPVLDVDGASALLADDTAGGGVREAAAALLKLADDGASASV